MTVKQSIRKRSALKRLKSRKTFFESLGKDKFSKTGEFVRTYAQEMTRMNREIEVLETRLAGKSQN